jgi:hypothetical protein
MAQRWGASAVSWLLVCVISSICVGPAAAQAGPTPRQQKEAAARFDRGQALYKEGRFAEAIAEFEAANQLAPHPSSQFNIARCHENLGNWGKALEAYQKLEKVTDDPARRLFIQQRIQRLTSRPVKVFVHSEPGGASITVGGRKQPEGKTPTVVQLVPGEHVLLLRLEGYQVAARRVAVEMDQEQVVQVVLEPLPRAEPPPPTPCAKPAPCPRLDLTDPRNLHFHLAALGAVGWIYDLPTGTGLGGQLRGSAKNLVFGAHFLWLFTGEEPPIANTYDSIRLRWLLFQAEGGWVFAFPSFYLTTTVGLGLATERLVYKGGTITEDVREEFGFAWSLGGGIEAMATRWLSLGVAARFGLVHGYRPVDRRDRESGHEFRHYPYGTLWASATFHL